MQSWFNIRKSTNVNQAKADKLYDHNQLNPEQHLAKSKPIHDKDSQLTRKREHPQIDKEHLQKTHKTYEKANIILNDERLNTFLLRLGIIRQECLLSPFLFNTVWEFLSSGTRQREKKDKT